MTGQDRRTDLCTGCRTCRDRMHGGLGTKCISGVLHPWCEGDFPVFPLETLWCFVGICGPVTSLTYPWHSTNPEESVTPCLPDPYIDSLK